MNKFSLLGLACAATLIGSSSLASAQERVPEPPADDHAGTVVNAPPGSGGLTVVAPTPGGGTVVANGCSQVMVNGSPTYVTPSGEPCPQYAPYQPYGARSAYDVRPRYARDPERTGALIASSVVWGVGSAVTGIAYLFARADTSTSCTDTYSSTGLYTGQNCTTSHKDATGALVTYGALVSITPSVPRFVMGDVGKGLLYTGIRGASVLVASVVDWGHNDSTSWEMPFLLGFCVPVALGIVDLATTPHREDLEEKADQTTGITSVAPVALSDWRGTHGGMLAVAGRF